MGIDKDPAMIEEARTWLSMLGSIALQIGFRQEDMLQLPFTTPSFEAIFVTRSLQELRDRRQAHRALANIQEVTSPKGYNFVTAYVGTRREQASKPHLAIFKPGEIEDYYTESGWKVIHAYRDIKSPLTLVPGETLLRSYDEIVVQKPA
jgi:ubiquinone/menaquinone biosynthesis C-methylase UbiE